MLKLRSAPATKCRGRSTIDRTRGPAWFAPALSGARERARDDRVERDRVTITGDKKMKRLVLAFALTLAAASPSLAQTAFPSPDNRNTAPLVVQGCLNASAQAVPCPPGGITPTSAPSAGITPVVGGSAVSSLVLKGFPGNLYSAYAECTAACWLMVFNRIDAPTNGATTAGVASGNMVHCIPIIAGGAGSISNNGMPPDVFSVGITAAISSTTCATLTLATTGFINGKVQ
jgi:hypothetical protein